MIYFESRNEQYRCPTGAVRVDEPVTFRLKVSDAIQVKEVHFAIKEDGGEERVIVMAPEVDGFYSVTIAQQSANLYFYRFEIVQTNGQFLFVGRGDGGCAVIGDWLPNWKLTVFDKDFEVADKWKGGVMYQIFPDRFARAGDKEPEVSAPGKRFFHTDTREKPFDYADESRPGGKDYYGGSIAGVREKLPYLQQLGVTIIYFNPVFESGENHRYSTADYMKIDPYFGTEEEFESFCAEAKEYGMEVILDGVFSHTGADSRYFNKEGYYDTLGAYNSKESPYYNWYQFEQYPDKYTGWWGFKNLPNVNETCPEYLEFITGENGVAAHWQSKGAAGWRLDVADELPDEFLEALRRRVKTEDPDSYIVGEVWEHAVEKISYGARRRFLLGKQCDSVMNYPGRDAIIQLVKTGNVSAFGETAMTLCEDYPRPALDTLMNILSTHDTSRILSELGAPVLPRKMQAEFRLSPEQKSLALSRLRVAALMQFTLPGIPCIYYGDEIGMEGFADPYCRAFFEWENAENSLRDYYCCLGQLRRRYRENFKSDFTWLGYKDGVMRYKRGDELTIVFNFSDEPITPEGTLLVSSGGNKTLLPGEAGVYDVGETTKMGD